MDSPAPQPTAARNPVPAPLSEELKRNYQKDLDRFEEEKFASRNSFPTKLLGWMLIAGFGFQVAGMISNSNQDFGGLIFLFAGIIVLRGSQPALRFVTFFIVPAAVFGILGFIAAIVLNKPVEIDHTWTSYHDLKFWTLGVSPSMYFVAESLVAICALRLRRLPFWTKTVRLSAAVVGAAYLLSLGFAIRDLIRQREIRRSLPEELAAAKAYFHSYGGRISAASMKSSELTFSGFPNILQVEWKNSPNSTTKIYQKKAGGDIPVGKHLDHHEWFRLPSGDWGKIEMKVVLPKNP